MTIIKQAAPINKRITGDVRLIHRLAGIEAAGSGTRPCTEAYLVDYYFTGQTIVKTFKQFADAEAAFNELTTN